MYIDILIFLYFISNTVSFSIHIFPIIPLSITNSRFVYQLQTTTKRKPTTPKRKKKLWTMCAFLDTAIPPCSQWPSLSGKLHVSKIRGVQLKSKNGIFFGKKWLGGTCTVQHEHVSVHMCVHT